ncbi:hypothetical protein BT93_F2576 [Corymbia citriodora subsp. variegata]|nr:hypothetical protein BT93_F2576 [Corymbia citriodora subsp. variegata]
MSKVFVEIQTLVLKVYINCDGCKQQVTKTLQKIDGVFEVKVDKEQNKVTVSGTAAPALLIEKLKRKGKHAELLDAQKSSDTQFKDIHTGDGKVGNKDQKGQQRRWWRTFIFNGSVMPFSRDTSVSPS